MKVAVLSLEPTCGKTSLITTLSAVFARSQRRTVCILNTGSAKDNVEVIEVLEHNADLSNPYVFHSMVQAANGKDLDLFNYGIRQGDEPVYVYDVMGTPMDREEAEEYFFECLYKLPADLTLVEIHGDFKEDFNQRVIKKCDCCLVLFETSPMSFRRLIDFDKSGDINLNSMSGYVCSRYNPSILSENKMSKKMGIPVANTFIFPYSPIVPKMSLNASLDRIGYEIVKGNPELAPFRSRMLEIMQFIFDMPDRKVIRGLDRWYS